MFPVATFLEMGGYGAFVWSAYGVTALVMVGLLWTSLRSGRRERDLMDVMTAERRARRGDAETQS
jgi:heme exporter protein D